MNIRTTTDPISMKDVPSPETHPSIYEGDGENGIKIYFENEKNREEFLKIKIEGNIVLKGDDSEDYVAEG